MKKIILVGMIVAMSLVIVACSQKLPHTPSPTSSKETTFSTVPTSSAGSSISSTSTNTPQNGSSKITSPAKPNASSLVSPPSDAKALNGLPDSGAHGSTLYVEDIVRNYVSLRVDAINSKDFNMIGNLLQQNSAIHSSEKKKFDDLMKNNVTEQFIAVDEDIQSTAQPTTFKVYVTEQIALKAGKAATFAPQTNTWIFTVMQTPSNICITDIQPWAK